MLRSVQLAFSLAKRILGPATSLPGWPRQQLEERRGNPVHA